MNRAGRFLPILAAVAVVASGCGGSAESPLAPDTARAGATIRGTLQTASAVSPDATAAAAASGVRVSVVGTALASETDASGRFVLQGVPEGRATLRFEAPGLDARLEIEGLAAGQVLTITVHVSGRNVVMLPSPSASPSPGQGAETEFRGRVQSVTPPSLRVADRTVVTTASTRIRRRGDPIALTAILPGDVVEVEGREQADGSILASKLTLEDGDDEDGDEDDSDDDDGGDDDGGDDDDDSDDDSDDDD